MEEEVKDGTELKTIDNLKKDVEEYDEKFDSNVKMKDLSAEEAFEAERASVDYNAKNLQVLEGMEAVRRRPGMYIGSTSSVGLHHLVWEIVDNAVTEPSLLIVTKIVLAKPAKASSTALSTIS